MEFERDSRRTRELNLTPLVDIILMLVIFFMLSTSFVVSESMELALPSDTSTANPTPPSSTASLQIQLLPSGELWVESKTLTREALNTLLAERLATDPDTNITLFTTPGVRVQQLVHVLDDVYLTGGRNVQVDKVAYGN